LYMNIYELGLKLCTQIQIVSGYAAQNKGRNIRNYVGN
jgi:hypothetical protein